jgi:DNA-binding response OmpR family regulator
MKNKILLVEDEETLFEGIFYNLKKNGFQVTGAKDGESALSLATSQSFDLILLDLMLPKISGFDVCKKLREKKIHTPILMLTARGEIENKLKGLELGADDYLVKPFLIEELIARVEAQLRRSIWSEQTPANESFQFKTKTGFIEFDADNFELRSSDKKHIALTALEQKLLLSLIQNKGKTLSRNDLLEKVWGISSQVQTRTLDNFILRLRHYLEELGGESTWIESVRGVGYRYQYPNLS